MFRGPTKISVDAKGRIVMPARYRDQLQALAAGNVVVTADRDGCLLVYPQPVWAAVERDLMNLPTQHEPSRALQRLMVGHATDMQLDSHGRLQLTQELRDYAGMKRDAMLVGQGERFELWDEGRWSKRLAQDIALAGAGTAAEPPEEWKKAKW